MNQLHGFKTSDTRSTTDNRGLTSVIFRLHGKEYALDYLTKKELTTFLKTGKY